ncbi:MAG: D-sedoheptulose 7-phosphate isomerase [Deltaproteobacteria bacterium]|nr:D-sedoheptulose 7-phosphate isomerase [Deltaproteobacteria bacterium]
MKDVVDRTVQESIRVKKSFFEKNADLVLTAARRLATCAGSGHKVLIFGNGGSAADAQHIAAEFVNRFAVERRPLPAVALTTDTSILTAVANDYAFDEIFSKQVQALGKQGDIAWGISTSGNSKNVLVAMDMARDMGLGTLGLTGCGGGAMAERYELNLTVDSNNTPRIQETHITVAHVLCDLVERLLFPESFMEE